MIKIDVAHLYFINLATRPDRLEHMQRQLAPCSWPTTRIEGIRIDRDPTEIGIEVLQRLKGQWGVVGIWLSHRKALQAALDTGKDGAFVLLEDDVRIEENYWTPRLRLHPDLPSNWEIVLLSPRHRLNPSAANGTSSPRKWLKDPFKGKPVLLKSQRGRYITTGAHFVVFRNAAVVRRVIAAMDACTLLYDVDLFYLQEFRSYGLYDRRISTEPLGSDHG